MNKQEEYLQYVADHCIRCHSCRCYHTTSVIGTMCYGELAVLLLKHEKQGLASSIFGCHQCGLCLKKCPQKFNTKEFMFHARAYLEQQNRDYCKCYEDIRVDRAEHIFARQKRERGIRYQDALEQEGDCSRLFMPGCHMASGFPKLTGQVADYLKKEDIADGMTSRCCGNPLYAAGFYQEFLEYVGKMGALCREHHVEEIITPCPSCYDFYKRVQTMGYLEGVEVKCLSKELVDRNIKIRRSAFPKDYKVSIHDSCPDRKNGIFADSIRKLYGEFVIEELPHIKEDTLCCGCGGLVPLYSQEISDEGKILKRKDFEQTGSDCVITTCFNCYKGLKQVLPIHQYLEDLMAGRIMLPSATYVGEDALQKAMKNICALGSRALIVTGKSMIRQGHVEKMMQMLAESGVRSAVYSEITGEPTDEMIEAGVEQYRKEACDFIIGFGGGSPLDSAKAIGAMVTNPGKLADYNGREITNPTPPIAAIPTTAGTGSEATQFAIITDRKKNIKMLLKGVVLMPSIAVVDARFTMNVPQNVTAATGLDALTHGIEAYTSRKAFDESDQYAVSAIKRIFRFLPVAYRDGNNETAREQMALASYEAGVSFNNSSVTLVHGMSRPIGALFHVPHGISNAMLLSECLRFAADGVYDRLGQLGRSIGVAKVTDHDQRAADKFLKAVEGLCGECEVPTLKEFGIDRDEYYEAIDKMAQDAYDSGSPANTRKRITREDMKGIYERLWF